MARKCRIQAPARGPELSRTVNHAVVAFAPTRHIGQMRIGVRRRLGRLEAHAWVEHLGHVLDDDADVADRFAPFDSLEALFPPPGAGVR